MIYTDLLTSIAATIADYRHGELEAPDAQHVGRWINQFDAAVRQPMLEELAHILQRTYFSKAKVTRWLTMLAANADFVGLDPGSFWSNASLLELQPSAKSQAEMIRVLRQTVHASYGSPIGIRASTAGPFIYLDDFLFTGNTAINELREWLTTQAPENIELHIVAMGIHRGAEHYVKTRLAQVASDAKKMIDINFWASARYEDRNRYVNNSEVFRPASASGDPHVDSYVAELVAKGRAPTLRSHGAMPASGIFHSSTTRDILEQELLKAGAAILARCNTRKPSMRPLGYAKLDTLGFGALVATYRKAPNNMPLALWWGDPEETSGALAWYPLLRRSPTAGADHGLMSMILGRTARTTTRRPVTVSRMDSHERERMPWEVAAEDAVTREVESLDFDVEDKVVRIPLERGFLVFENIEELRSHLESEYDQGWYGYVPFDGGEAVFDGDATDAVDDALSGLEEELQSIGWEL